MLLAAIIGVLALIAVPAAAVFAWFEEGDGEAVAIYSFFTLIIGALLTLFAWGVGSLFDMIGAAA